MKLDIDPKHFAAVCHALRSSDARSAVKYLSEKVIIRATWRFKPNSKNRHEEMVVTLGAPNYLEAKFIKQCKQAGVSFPIRKIQFKAYPKTRVKKAGQR